MPFLCTIALTAGYFIILGGTGGTVFQRLFAMRRIVPGADTRGGDEDHCTLRREATCANRRREDGLYSFVEERRVRGSDGEPNWRPYPSFAALCHSADAALRQARAAIGWVGLMPWRFPCILKVPGHLAHCSKSDRPTSATGLPAKTSLRRMLH